MARFLALLIAAFTVPTAGLAASSEQLVEAAGKNGQYTYVMFYRVNDRASQNMAGVIETHVAATGGTTAWVRVNVGDAAQAALVERFDASRMPLPSVIGVAPNGAVTGVYRKSVSEEQLANAVLTPQYSEMVKALQSQKIAVVCLKPTADTAVPECVPALRQLPEFYGKTHEVVADGTDDAESEFFRRMKVDRGLDAPVLLMFAPPGNYLGTFPATTSATELAEALHKTGKCNCHKCQAKGTAK